MWGARRTYQRLVAISHSAFGGKIFSARIQQISFAERSEAKDFPSKLLLIQSIGLKGLLQQNRFKIPTWQKKSPPALKTTRSGILIS
jgi:hypothetical protein